MLIGLFDVANDYCDEPSQPVRKSFELIFLLISIYLFMLQISSLRKLLFLLTVILLLSLICIRITGLRFLLITFLSMRIHGKRMAPL